MLTAGDDSARFTKFVVLFNAALTLLLRLPSSTLFQKYGQTFYSERWRGGDHLRSELHAKVQSLSFYRISTFFPNFFQYFFFDHGYYHKRSSCSKFVTCFVYLLHFSFIPIFWHDLLFTYPFDIVSDHSSLESMDASDGNVSPTNTDRRNINVSNKRLI